MKHSIKIILVLCACVMTTGIACAQKESMATWTSLSIKKNITPKFGLTFRSEYRSQNNMKDTEMYFFRLTGNYKICPHLSVALAYDWHNAYQGHSAKGNLAVDSWIKHSHRILADIQGAYKYQLLNFTLRERYVYANAVSTDAAAKDENGLYQTWSSPDGESHLLRSMPTVTYSIPNSMFSPYVAAEFFNSLNEGDNFKLNQYHLFAGTNIKLDKTNSLKVFYVFQKKQTADKILHTIGFDYIISLP